MGDHDDDVGNKELVPSGSSSGNGSENKRKYMAESLSDKFNTLSVTETSRCELLKEHLQKSSNEVELQKLSEPDDNEEHDLNEVGAPSSVTETSRCELLKEHLQKSSNEVELQKLSESDDNEEHDLNEVGAPSSVTETSRCELLMEHLQKSSNEVELQKLSEPDDNEEHDLNEVGAPSSVTETSRCELLMEHLQKSSNEVELQKLSESDDDEEHDSNEWGAPVVSEIMLLLSENLHKTFERAILKMVDLGYNKDIAEQTFLRCGLYHSTKDTASNAVDGALIFMNRENKLETPRCGIFSDFEKLVDYTLLEMVSVLKQVSPGISVAEALWVLLVSDLNLLHACVVNGNHLSTVSLQDVYQEVSFGSVFSKLRPEIFEPLHAFLKNMHFSKSIALSSQSSNSEDLTVEAAVKGEESSVSTGKSAGAREKDSLNVSKGPTAEENSAVCQKSSFGSSEREMRRQRALHMEKIYRDRVRGACKTKVPCCGMRLDNPPKLPSSSSGIPMKSTFSDVSPCAGANCPLHAGNSNVSNVSLSVPQAADDAPSAMDSKGAVFRVPAPHAKTPPSLALELGPTSKPSGYISGSSGESHCCAGIHCHGSHRKVISKDEEDSSIIVSIVSYLKGRQNEIYGWKDWARNKIMEATQRLIKDQDELRMLRQEAERFKNDKKAREENCLRLISEIENAINNVGDQLLILNATVWSLDKENSELHTKLEASKEREYAADTNLKKASLKELELSKRIQTTDREKIFLKEKLTALKQEAEGVRRQLERTEERNNQLQITRNREEREKLNYLAQVEDARRQREGLLAKLKADEECMREKAANKSQSRDQHIKKLTDEISQLNLSFHHPKISEFLGGCDVNYGGSYESKMLSIWQEAPGLTVNERAAVSKGNLEVGLKPERECVMCLSEEMAVLFFPCAHQVLCEGCNVLHEKKGMKECPSCRTPIQARVKVRFQGY